MQSAAEVDATLLRRAVCEAVEALYREDRSLLSERAHERSVVFHLGRRLLETVSRWHEQWQIDVDYNRAQDAQKLERVKKHLPASAGRDEGAVLPDLIVHHRSHSGPDANLLVLECKWAPADRSVDYGKLLGFQEVFGYRLAAYLELLIPPEAPRLLWCDARTTSVQALRNPMVTPPSMW